MFKHECEWNVQTNGMGVINDALLMKIMHSRQPTKSQERRDMTCTVDIPKVRRKEENDSKRSYNKPNTILYKLNTIM